MALRNGKRITFFDTEVAINSKKILDTGACREDGANCHTSNINEFLSFILDTDFLCGHNAINFDKPILEEMTGRKIILPVIDTLYLSPLLFPKKPYHKLLKDDKFQEDEFNNPLNDSKKAMELLYDEIEQFMILPMQLKQIFAGLLCTKPEFKGFFTYVDFNPLFLDLENLIKNYFQNKICSNAKLSSFIEHNPKELAYALALINVDDHRSITPPWLSNTFPEIESIIKLLRGTPCKEKCEYCKNILDAEKNLKIIFGYDEFRSYNGVPLQKMAAEAAIDGRSLLAVFPTGGGKSITFQLPAIIAGMTSNSLTIIISPLQSLMKDQIDNLEAQGIVDAVSINGLLSAVERSNALERIIDGSANLLYISPEQLRSRTIERILRSRNIARFVIDEAHCFSAWGQDFRVDYLYIGEFIRELQKTKGANVKIPVSCFTATAKQKVITDICDYFKTELNLDLELFASDADRENLHYTVLHKETENEKYNSVRNLILQKDCSTIVYVSRTKRTEIIAEKLTKDGILALPYHGQMDSNKKIETQEAFKSDKVRVIVATSAFGMGVDKKDVKLVIHYDISDSLENYIQEAGRAGRDPSLQADCYILFNDSDLDTHFTLLNQTKLSISEIQQIWKAVKDMSKFRSTILSSPLEIARQAGWDEEVHDIETRVKTAISTLEQAGYVKRGHNVPHVYANSIQVKSVIEANEMIDSSQVLSDRQKDNARRIIKSLISKRSVSKAGNSDAESRIDYLSDYLGIDKKEVIEAVDLMKEIGLLADHTDMSAYILKSDSQNKSLNILEKYIRLEGYLFEKIIEDKNKEYRTDYEYKELNDEAIDLNMSFSSIRKMKTIIYFWTISNYIKKPEYVGKDRIAIGSLYEINELQQKINLRNDISRFLVEYLYQKAERRENNNSSEENKEQILTEFSVNELLRRYQETPRFDFDKQVITLQDIESALLYLSKIGAMILEGGFLVVYNGIQLKRLIMDNRIKYKASDYKTLNDYYKQKIQQIHIVGEYANLMVRDYNTALTFVHDYFQLDYKKFISKYFDNNRLEEIERNITPQRYQKLFGSLSKTQLDIIKDDTSKYIVVAAGPGSGKTRLLVHKLAALLQMEDVKSEQLLMLTFSRAAAMEFKSRLFDLIDGAAAQVDIKTFHSYCFELIGKIGCLEEAEDIVKDATEMIYSGEVEPGQATKSVLVIDEAQDMDEKSFEFVKALMSVNEDMRIIAVGDDDQNIYAFRGSDSKYFQSLITKYDATKYELLENYRSKKDIVHFANSFINSKKHHLIGRMKQSDTKAVSSENGMVNITYHTTKNIEIPLVQEVCDTYHSGSACILTKTNDEALRIYGLINKQGKKAKLIQSADGFHLMDLQEIQFFIEQIEKELNIIRNENNIGSLIPDDAWVKAKESFCEEYSSSLCYENCIRLIEVFEKNSMTKFLSDFIDFVHESKYEDFYEKENEIIYVSTIHKSKGREFDTVYIMLNGNSADNSESVRALYVALTRAKNNLFIHCNTTIFENILPELKSVNKVVDRKEYAEPSELLILLTHKDVNLGHFIDKKETVKKLKSGDKIKLENYFIFVEIEGSWVQIARLSKSRVEMIQKLQAKEYQAVDGTIQFIVSWKPKNEIKEVKEKQSLNLGTLEKDSINKSFHKEDVERRNLEDESYWITLSTLRLIKK